MGVGSYRNARARGTQVVVEPPARYEVTWREMGALEVRPSGDSPSREDRGGVIHDTTPTTTPPC